MGVCLCGEFTGIHEYSFSLSHFATSGGSSSFMEMIIPAFSGNLCDDTAKPLIKSDPTNEQGEFAAGIIEIIIKF